MSTAVLKQKAVYRIRNIRLKEETFGALSLATETGQCRHCAPQTLSYFSSEGLGSIYGARFA